MCAHIPKHTYDLSRKKVQRRAPLAFILGALDGALFRRKLVMQTNGRTAR